MTHNRGMTSSPDSPRTIADFSAAKPYFGIAPQVAAALREYDVDAGLAAVRPPARLFQAAAAWQERRHGWPANPDDAIFLPKTTQLTCGLLNAGPRFYELDEPHQAAGMGPGGVEPGGAPGGFGPGGFGPGGMPPGMIDPAMALEAGAPLEVVAQLAQQQRPAEATADNGVPRVPVVVALSPTYGRVAAMVRASGAQLRMVRMQDFGGHLRINWPALENAMIGADYLLWMNPHNPTGRTWTVEELQRVGYLAEIYRTTVISDDIHADFAPTYTSMAQACPGLFAAGKLVVCTSPTIAFGMSGMHCAVAFAAGDLREEIEAVKRRLSLTDASPLAIAAALAAWEKGDVHADMVCERTTKAVSFARDFLSRELPDAHLTTAEGSCLLWGDFSAYDDAAGRCAAAGVPVSEGGSFGETWQGWVRLAVAMPQDALCTGLQRLVEALQD